MVPLTFGFLEVCQVVLKGFYVHAGQTRNTQHELFCALGAWAAGTASKLRSRDIQNSLDINKM